MELMERCSDLDAAVADLERRTLCEFPGSFARLIYLASTRDYNSGQYYHGGLATSFPPDVAEAALGKCHEKTFDQVVLLPLKRLRDEITEYMQATHVNASELIKTWQTLEPFRVAIPRDCDPLEAELFCSNVRIALAILREQQDAHPDGQQCA